MRAIPKKLREEMEADPFMAECIQNECDGKNCTPRIEWEHAFTYAGKQINEKWAIVPACTYHHRGAGLDKDFNRYIAIMRATDEDFAKYPRFDWQQLKRFLSNKYDD